MKLISIIVVIFADFLSTNATVQWITDSNEVETNMKNDSFKDTGTSLCSANNSANRRMMCAEVMVKMKSIGKWSDGRAGSMSDTQPTYKCVRVVVENVGEVDVYGCTLKQFDPHQSSTSASGKKVSYEEGFFVTVGDKARDSVYVIIKPTSIFDSPAGDFKAVLQMNNFDTRPYIASKVKTH